MLNLKPMLIIMDIMDIHLLITDMDIMVLVLLLMLDVLSGELENKLLLYLQLNKKCFIHILQKKLKYKTLKTYIKSKLKEIVYFCTIYKI